MQGLGGPWDLVALLTTRHPVPARLTFSWCSAGHMGPAPVPCPWPVAGWVSPQGESLASLSRWPSERLWCASPCPQDREHLRRIS